MNFRIDKGTVFITLSQGEQINQTFEAYAKANKIGSAWLSGIGAIAAPEIGYYSMNSKSYHRRKYEGEYELTSLVGNITIKDGKYFSHTHITFSDTNYQVFGGHLFDARITAAGEFIMLPGSEDINRKINPVIGLSLWCLDKHYE